MEEDFSELLQNKHGFDLLLVDVPIGLPDNEETLVHREEVDSLARSVTGRSSSVFPVPSREAAKQAYEGADYEDVAKQNEQDIAKGLTKQSYQIAAGIGEIDELLKENEKAREVVIEGHPEVCFRGLLGCQLRYSKDTAAGVGERLKALRSCIDQPGALLEEVTADLIGESADVEIDDVVDAIALGVVASQSELQYLPKEWENDSESLPMRMAWWIERAIPSNGHD